MLLELSEERCALFIQEREDGMLNRPEILGLRRRFEQCRNALSAIERDPPVFLSNRATADSDQLSQRASFVEHSRFEIRDARRQDRSFQFGERERQTFE